MSICLRIILLVVSVLLALYVFRKIKKAQFVVGDTIFWLVFCLLLLFIGIFPKVTYWASALIGIESPANFIFLVVIFLLLVKIFLLSLKVSKLETKLGFLIQKYALDNAKKDK